MFLQYTVFFLCSLCTFVGNIATVGGGGGLYVYKAPYVHLQTVNFTANLALPLAQAASRGGAVYAFAIDPFCLIPPR